MIDSSDNLPIIGSIQKQKDYQSPTQINKGIVITELG